MHFANHLPCRLRDVRRILLYAGTIASPYDIEFKIFRRNLKKKNKLINKSIYICICLSTLLYDVKPRPGETLETFFIFFIFFLVLVHVHIYIRDQQSLILGQFPGNGRIYRRIVEHVLFFKSIHMKIYINSQIVYNTISGNKV